MDWLPRYKLCAARRPKTRHRERELIATVVPDICDAQRLWADVNLHAFGAAFHRVHPARLCGKYLTSRYLFCGPVDISVVPTGQLVKSTIPMVHEMLVENERVTMVTGLPPGVATGSPPPCIQSSGGAKLYVEPSDPYLPCHPKALCRSCFVNMALEFRGRCPPCIMKDHPWF